VINITADLLELDVVAFTDFLGDFGNGERHIPGQQCFSVFNGKDYVVVSIVC